MKKVLLGLIPLLIIFAFFVSWFFGSRHQEFIKAVRVGDLRKVQELSTHMPLFLLDAYHKPPGMGTKSLYGVTALHIAIKHSRVKIIKFLIGEGVNLDALTAGYRNPLQLAAERGLLEGVDLLLVNDAEVDKCGSTSESKTALFLAAENLHPEVVERLLAAGADSQKSDHTGQAPREAARKRQLLYDENSPEERFGYGKNHKEFNAWVAQRRFQVITLLDQAVQAK